MIALILGLLTMNCTSSEDVKKAPHPEPITPLDIPPIEIEKSKLHYNPKNSLWTLDGKRFSGYAISTYPDRTLKQKIGMLDGRKQNQASDYYPDGQPRLLAHYHKGKLHGEKKAWLSDSAHTLISHLNYRLGKLHGEQKKWYDTGEIFKILHLNMGKEEGIQRAFRKNGALFANYEARDGRIFGLKRASLCYELDEEEIQY